MARKRLSPDLLKEIVEDWIERHGGGGNIRYWDVTENGTFRGCVTDNYYEPDREMPSWWGSLDKESPNA